MILNMKNSAQINKDYKKWQFNVEKMKEKTYGHPTWIHMGAGNIFRAFLASCQQRLLNNNVAETGIVVAEGFDYEIVDILSNYDNLTVNVTLKSDGEVEKEIVASIAEYIRMDRTYIDEFARLENYFCNPSLQMVSLTITEKGYKLKNNAGHFYSEVERDLVNDPKESKSYIGKIASLLYSRYRAGAYPLAIVSMDNMSHNGEKMEEAIMTFVDYWTKNGLVEQSFMDYMLNRNKITFPWTMIDKITPRPSLEVQVMLEKDGFEEMHPVTTQKNTYVAPFVNGEEVQYLVIEDDFPNGRPELEKAGILFTDRETVNKVETMKVTTCLNPLHTALALFGCLFDYSYIYDEMTDNDLVSLVKLLGFKEGLPVVTDPEIISPESFLNEVLDKRLANKYIPDSPQRIATDTSQKLGIRFGETVKKYLEAGKDIQLLKGIPLVYAAWFRYLQGRNDQLEVMSLSPDPLLVELESYFKLENIDTEEHYLNVLEIMKNKEIFGVDLVEIGLAEIVLDLYRKMNQGQNAVRSTLQLVLSEVIDNEDVF